MQKKIFFLLIAFVFFNKSNAQFTAGNIVVYRIGEGTATATTLGANDAFAVFLDEYTPSGTLVRSIAMPATDNGSNKSLTASSSDGIAGSGMLNLSADGQYLVFTGYNAPLGTTGLGGTRSNVTARVIGLVKYDGTI
ncbi:MAG TPA: hypothetical protein VHM26_11055, partial [Chitinophagaceae bacterium]|nr:hypothetical protein [Chitinophagaceae bacterium]